MEQIQLQSGARLTPTISVGVATAQAGETAGTALIERADRALYEAKAAGRNCVRAGAPGSRSLTALASLPAPSTFLAH
jgi:diguanylate cyclase (GGDEF)-like protein